MAPRSLVRAHRERSDSLECTIALVFLDLSPGPRLLGIPGSPCPRWARRRARRSGDRRARTPRRSVSAFLEYARLIPVY